MIYYDKSYCDQNYNSKYMLEIGKFHFGVCTKVLQYGVLANECQYGADEDWHSSFGLVLNCPTWVMEREKTHLLKLANQGQRPLS